MALSILLPSFLKAMKGASLPNVGDTIQILGKPIKVVDFGMWSEMKTKYPQASQRALAGLPSNLTEDKLGRTWVLQDGQGEYWLVGKAGLQMFVKPYTDHKSLEGSHKFGVLIAVLPEALRKQITDWTIETIPDFHLGKGGRESNPHVTIKYGFKDCSPETVQTLRSMFGRSGPFSIQLKGLSLFEGNADGDVLKVDVESPELHEINSLIAQSYDCSGDKRPEYQPHLTLAYLTPEASKLYLEESPPFLNQVVRIDEVQWSGTEDEDKQIIPLSFLNMTKALESYETKRWVTLDPSGTHVDIEGDGTISKGPKGMTGKKPSQLSKTPIGKSKAKNKQGKLASNEYGFIDDVVKDKKEGKKPSAKKAKKLAKKLLKDPEAAKEIAKKHKIPKELTPKGKKIKDKLDEKEPNAINRLLAGVIDFLFGDIISIAKSAFGSDSKEKAMSWLNNNSGGALVGSKPKDKDIKPFPQGEGAGQTAYAIAQWAADQWAELEKTSTRKDAFATVSAMVARRGIPYDGESIMKTAEGLRGLTGFAQHWDVHKGFPSRYQTSRKGLIYSIKGKGTCGVGQNPERDDCKKATDDPSKTESKPKESSGSGSSLGSGDKIEKAQQLVDKLKSKSGRDEIKSTPVKDIADQIKNDPNTREAVKRTAAKDTMVMANGLATMVALNPLVQEGVAEVSSSLDENLPWGTPEEQEASSQLNKGFEKLMQAKKSSRSRKIIKGMIKGIVKLPYIVAKPIVKGLFKFGWSMLKAGTRAVTKQVAKLGWIATATGVHVGGIAIGLGIIGGTFLAVPASIGAGSAAAGIIGAEAAGVGLKILATLPAITIAKKVTEMVLTKAQMLLYRGIEGKWPEKRSNSAGFSTHAPISNREHDRRWEERGYTRSDPFKSLFKSLRNVRTKEMCKRGQNAKRDNCTPKKKQTPRAAGATKPTTKAPIAKKPSVNKKPMTGKVSTKKPVAKKPTKAPTDKAGVKTPRVKRPPAKPESFEEIMNDLPPEIKNNPTKLARMKNVIKKAAGATHKATQKIKATVGKHTPKIVSGAALQLHSMAENYALGQMTQQHDPMVQSFGIDSKSVMEMVAKVLVKAKFWAAAKLKGKGKKALDQDSLPLDQQAQYIADYLNEIFESMGVETKVDPKDVLKNLEKKQAEGNEEEEDRGMGFPESRFQANRKSFIYQMKGGFDISGWLNPNNRFVSAPNFSHLETLSKIDPKTADNTSWEDGYVKAYLAGYIRITTEGTRTIYCDCHYSRIDACKRWVLDNSVQDKLVITAYGGNGKVTRIFTIPLSEKSLGLSYFTKKMCGVGQYPSRDKCTKKPEGQGVDKKPTAKKPTTVRTRKKPIAKKPVASRKPASPKRSAQAKPKVSAAEKRKVAVEAVKKAINHPKDMTPDEQRDLPNHLLKMSVPELQAIKKERDLKSSKKKKDLVDAIKGYISSFASTMKVEKEAGDSGKSDEEIANTLNKEREDHIRRKQEDFDKLSQEQNPTEQHQFDLEVARRRLNSAKLAPTATAESVKGNREYIAEMSKQAMDAPRYFNQPQADREPVNKEPRFGWARSLLQGVGGAAGALSVATMVAAVASKVVTGDPYKLISMMFGKSMRRKDLASNDDKEREVVTGILNDAMTDVLIDLSLERDPAGQVDRSAKQQMAIASLMAGGPTNKEEPNEKKDKEGQWTRLPESRFSSARKSLYYSIKAQCKPGQNPGRDKCTKRPDRQAAGSKPSVKKPVVSASKPKTTTTKASEAGNRVINAVYNIPAIAAKFGHSEDNPSGLDQKKAEQYISGIVDQVANAPISELREIKKQMKISKPASSRQEAVQQIRDAVNEHFGMYLRAFI